MRFVYMTTDSRISLGSFLKQYYRYFTEELFRRIVPEQTDVTTYWLQDRSSNDMNHVASILKQSLAS